MKQVKIIKKRNNEQFLHFLYLGLFFLIPYIIFGIILQRMASINFGVMLFLVFLISGIINWVFTYETYIEEVRKK